MGLEFQSKVDWFVKEKRVQTESRTLISNMGNLSSSERELFMILETLINHRDNRKEPSSPNF